MTSSNGNIFRVTGPLCGEFTGPGEFPTQRPVTRSFDVFFDLRLNKRLSKQPWGWWFETPSRSLWRQCNVLFHKYSSSFYRSRYQKLQLFSRQGIPGPKPGFFVGSDQQIISGVCCHLNAPNMLSMKSRRYIFTYTYPDNANVTGTWYTCKVYPKNEYRQQ